MYIYIYREREIHTYVIICTCIYTSYSMSYDNTMYDYMYIVL